MPRRPRRFTKKRRREFLENLERTGNASAAAAAAEISRSLAYAHRDADKEFAEAWDNAHHRWLDAVAGVAARRATVGEEVVVRITRTETNAEGKVLSTVTSEETRVYKSDRLLAQLLDRRHPDYKRAAAGGIHGGGGGGRRAVDIAEGVTEQEAANAYLELVTPPEGS